MISVKWISAVKMDSAVKDFYADKTLLITGGLGYIGKLLLAKLLKLGNVKELLLLIRSKKGKSNEERLNQLLDGFLFKEVENIDASFRSKIRIISGDMDLDGLGMTDDDVEYIKSNVQVIIHGAAALNMDGKLRKTLAANIRGTKQLLDIAVDAKNFQSFVFISTAYSQCARLDIKEKFYESPIDYRQALDILETLDLSDENLEVFTKKLIAPWPNVYTFSKAIAEDMVRQYQNRIPISIARPSVGKKLF